MEIVARTIRRALVRVLGSFVRRRRTAALAVLAGAGLLAANLLNLSIGLPGFAGGGSSPGYQPTTEGEPQSTATYIRGQQVHDATLIWDSYSDRVKGALQRRGIDRDETQRQLDRARDGERRLDRAQYVGTYPVPNGSMHFYVLTWYGRQRGDVSYEPYIFTLDSTGKIANVDKV